MPTRTGWLRPLILIALLGATGCGPRSAEPSEREQYEAFSRSLDVEGFEEGYPAVLEKLASEDPAERMTALRTIGPSGELDALPLVVEHVLQDPDPSVRIWAGSVLQNLVSTHELKRRDLRYADRIVLRPRSPEDVDLRPLAWVVREMLARPDDGNTHAYAATMIGYLGLPRFEPDLRRLLESAHPAVTRQAVFALRLLGFDVEAEPHPLNPEPRAPRME